MKRPITSGAHSANPGDAGVALITVIGVLALVTVLVIAGFALSQQALYESNMVRGESQAFQAANAALDWAVARVQYSGFNSTDYPKHFTVTDLGSGAATVTVTAEAGVGSYIFNSVGMSPDGAQETVSVRMYLIDLYGMNISYGARFNSGPSAGKLNGTATIYGPLYTFGNLSDSATTTEAANLPGGSGGIYWGPLMIKDGDIHSTKGAIDVGVIHYRPPRTVTVSGGVLTPKLIPSVPDFVVPPIDAGYLADARGRAVAESSDNKQGDPVTSQGTNSEVVTVGNPATYHGGFNRAPGCVSPMPYKVVDNDNVVNKSSPGLTIDSSTAAFGDVTADDFAYDGAGVLYVRGTVFIDGPLTTSRDIWYVGNGMLVVNGAIHLGMDFVPRGDPSTANADGLLPGKGGVPDTSTYKADYANQSFRPDQTLGIVTPYSILLDPGSSGNSSKKGAESFPTHAGAFYCYNTDQSNAAYGHIVLSDKTAVVGSLIARGIDFTGNNNQHLRTSANLGEVVSRSMPARDVLVHSFGSWSRR